MTLKKYRSKRLFESTPEPSGQAKREQTQAQLSYCIQKHAARQLHYDFRLEYRGVLLSWAVPKGPSLDPKDKRLAVHVEDHPLDYQYFEGVIPEGNYGAGKVEIWDKGTYTIPGRQDRQSMEKDIAEGLKKGHLAFVLEGERLQGGFVLQKLKSREPDDKNWLLIKTDDAKHIKDPPKKAKMPAFVSPMLATLVDHPFDHDDWLFEIKWDGYRALAFIDKGKVQLKSRNDHSLNAKFKSVVEELQKIDAAAIFDGELVILDEEGKSNFQLMQNYQRSQKGDLVYFVFDLLYYNGEDLRSRPLIERKELLQKIIDKANLPHIRFSSHVLKEGNKIFAEAAKANLEGIIGKRSLSSYQSKRSHDWVKMKTKQRQEVVIGGFSAPKGSRKKFGALLVGVYDAEGKLNYVAHVGGGFNAALLEDIEKKLKPLIQDRCPFKIVPKSNTPVTWVKPELVCEVSFSEWTQDQNLRQPIFQGLRFDKDPREVVKENAATIAQVPKEKPKKGKSQVKLTNLDKIYWPDEGYTKGDLIQYYESIAPYILPYLKERPIMLHRYPDGIEGSDFYQKDISDSFTEKWVKTFPVKHDGKVTSYLNIDDKDSLLFAVNLGSIDLHPFLSRFSNLENPDFCLIDLDPRDIPFQKTVETAQCIHQFLEEIGVKHYCKTSGGKGMHILIPLQGQYTFDQSRKFAEVIAHTVNQQLPFTSLERMPKKREKKVYLDCLQNRLGQTFAAPYSARPRPHATVSAPLDWSEVREGLDPSQFTIATMVQRLKEKGDLLKPLLKEKVDMGRALEKIRDISKK